MRALLAVTLAAVALGLDNGLGRTPQMGWNSWNHFGCNINENLIKSTIDTIVSSKLAAAGYVYVNLDDCWQSSRTGAGVIVPDPKGFPNGIKPLADYAHTKGVKFGVYSDAGSATCAGRPGSLGHEKVDAQTYAEWGVDYLKYDNCNTDGSSPKKRYPVMRDALNASGRAIFFSMCEWGVEDPATWSAPVGNSWRTTGDINDSWGSMTSILDQNDKWASYAAPGGWNDPDMLEVGNGHMSTAEDRSHFSLWCLIKAPLLVGCDITSMSAATKEILLNDEAIAINQDALGKQGKRLSDHSGLQVWGGPLSNGAYAAVLFNRNGNAGNITLNWSDLGVPATTALKVRDLWQHKDLGSSTGSFSATVPSHDVVMIKLTP